MKTTRYCEEQVLRKRAYIRRDGANKPCACHYAVRSSWTVIRHWIFVRELGKYLRVVTLEDGETIHNAFPDRDFEEVEA